MSTNYSRILQFYNNPIIVSQAQNCDWRNPSRRRKRRDLAEDEEGETISNTTLASTDSLSENLSLFQAIHVLQSDEEKTNNRTTSASSFYKSEQDELTSEDTICIESMMFASVIGESHLSLSHGIFLSLTCYCIHGGVHLASQAVPHPKTIKNIVCKP